MDWELFGTIIASAVPVLGGLWFMLSKVANITECTNRISALEGQIKELSKIVQLHNERFVAIETTLTIKHKGLESLFSQRHSPRVLNSLGEMLYKEMNGDDFLGKNKNALFAQIDSRNPKAGLDVEVGARVALALCMNEDFFIPIKNYVYNRAEIETEGGQKIDMTLETACYILSMPLRDLYLKEHPEIPTENL